MAAHEKRIANERNPWEEDDPSDLVPAKNLSRKLTTENGVGMSCQIRIGGFLFQMYIVD